MTADFQCVWPHHCETRQKAVEWKWTGRVERQGEERDKETHVSMGMVSLVHTHSEVFICVYSCCFWALRVTKESVPGG